MKPQACGKFLPTPIRACQAFGKTNIPYNVSRADFLTIYAPSLFPIGF